jgi:hypothetical protein
MRTLRIILIALLMVLFAGCPARSIHPLFTDNDVTFDPALIGTWISGDDSYTFSPSSDKSYRTVIHSLTTDDSSVYTVQAGTIGRSRYLDSYPYVNSDEHHYLSVHVFSLMMLTGDTLMLASFENDWLEKQIEAKKISLQHIKRGQEIIITATTKELQKMFRSIDGDSLAFPNRTIYTRVRQ